MGSFTVPAAYGFNPRSRVGSDTSTTSPNRKVLCFNPRSRVGSDANACSATVSEFSFQSTLPRGERPAGLAGLVFHLGVSIHAPAWGATALRNTKPLASRVSIHAPAWGATASLAGVVKEIQEFQSTLPRGERPRTPPPKSQNTHSFNPRSRVGSDRAFAADITKHSESFNPRSRVGSDALPLALAVRVEVAFQSTLPRGERLLCCRSACVPSLFQSTLPRGERRMLPADLSTGPKCFNPRSRVGSDQICAGREGNGSVSIHAPAWGATGGV